MKDSTKKIIMIFLIMLLLLILLFLVFLIKDAKNKSMPITKNVQATIKNPDINDFCLKIQTDAKYKKYPSASGVNEYAPAISDNEYCASLMVTYDINLELGDEEYYRQVYLGEPSLKEMILNRLSKYIGEKRALEVTNKLFEEADKKSLQVKLKTEITSVLPFIILCIKNNGVLKEPAPNNALCSNGQIDAKWPDLSIYDGVWGGCDFIYEPSTTNFQYCGKSNDGLIYLCNKEGCTNK